MSFVSETGSVTLKYRVKLLVIPYISVTYGKRIVLFPKTTFKSYFFHHNEFTYMTWVLHLMGGRPFDGNTIPQK